ncbi:hypothetical protein [Catenulispora pinisilvae]|uniref:hypothetical protein n=1 Tax=Catenulispora pinisilvae TaxID=2705253 RepID=UPI00189241BC|nr:hypothetical protein [Catenulispora pinisilvae]
MTTTNTTRRDVPSPSATALARALLDNGWQLASVAVRVIHIASLTDGSGLTVAVSSEAGRVRLDFDSEYRYLRDGLSRLAWHAEASRELSIEVLAAVTSANTAATVDDPTEVADQLTTAGWSQPYPLEQKWISPDQDREVVFIDDELEDTPLPWEVRCKAGRPITIHASADTPAAVIVALALTTAPAHAATGKS